ncbi:multicopper oxidase family protein [Humibacter ginsengiterrae]
MSELNRRSFLAGGVGVAGGVGAAVLLGVGLPYALGPSSASSDGAVLVSRLRRPRPFTQPLRVPPVLSPTHSTADSDYYAITARQAAVSIVPGTTTRIFGFNGIFPGPTIISRRDRTTTVLHRNELPIPIVVHLHGGHTPVESDGYPIDLVYPIDMRYLNAHRMAMGGSMKGMPGIGSDDAGDVSHGQRVYTYPMHQRAATLWYHDHRMGFTGPSVWRGLAGFHLVRDEEEDALHLPSGRYELPLFLADRSFEADGSFRYPSTDPTMVNTPGVTTSFIAGVLGDVMLVNGVPWPNAAVDRASYRLRILNGCNARRLKLRLDPPPEGGIVQIGTEGGLLAAPLAHDDFELAEAQRLDAIIDFSQYRPGTEVTLYNDFGEGEMGRIMRFTIRPDSGHRYNVPDRLSDLRPVDASRAAITRSFRFQAGGPGWVVNAQPFSPDVALARPQLGQLEIWELFADSYHPVHAHLDPFQIIARGITGPGPYDAGWKDTIDLKPAEQARIAVQFNDYAGRFVFHCHNLEHEDMAMMANFITS